MIFPFDLAAQLISNIFAYPLSPNETKKVEFPLPMRRRRPFRFHLLHGIAVVFFVPDLLTIHFQNHIPLRNPASWAADADSTPVMTTPSAFARPNFLAISGVIGLTFRPNHSFVSRCLPSVLLAQKAAWL